ncbi:MAG: polysaccharide pyruvyl transferase CsaB [Oscillospiraceae bacterium]|nr:polysaccharide pyruvyl transferase CsaB [Oscillospiraceae bacterium]
MSKRKIFGRARRGVVISGAYGMDNAGDDAVLSAILAELRRMDRELPVTVLSRRPRQTGRRFGVSAVHPFRVLRWALVLLRSRLFLSGGGSLLQDVTSRRSLLYYLFTLRAARRLGCAVQLYGCGIGPLELPGDRERTAKTLNECVDIITLRDGDSEALLREMGVTRPTVLLAADPALTPPGPGGERERAIGFALRDWPGFRERIPALAEAARYAWTRYSLTPVFLCLAPEDREAARAVCGELGDVPCTVSVDPRRSARMSVVVSMRLHGLIFALRDGIPAAGIRYDPKVEAFCREAGLPCLPLEEAEPDALRALIDDALHLDGENLSASLETLRRRERVNGHAASELLYVRQP